MVNRKFWLGAAALGIFVALYIASPYYTLHRLERALEDGDRAALEGLIDWPSLRAGLKDDLNTLATRALAEQAGPGGDPEAALGMGIAAMFMPMLVQRTVDAYVTPAGIAALMRRQATPERPAEGKPQAQAKPWRFHLHGASFAGPTDFRFEFSNPDDPQPEPAIGVLELQGLSWRLTRLLLPIEDLMLEDLGAPDQERATSAP